MIYSVNGCSMKTEAQLEMIRKIPLERLLLETGMPAITKRGLCDSFCFQMRHGAR